MHPLKQYTLGSCTIRISLFYFPSSLSSSSIRAPAAFLEGANRKKKQDWWTSKHPLIFLVMYERLREYFSVWEPMGAAAWGTDLMSLPECFRAWQKITFRACSVSNSLLHSGYWRSKHVCRYSIHPAVYTYNMISHIPQTVFVYYTPETRVIMWLLQIQAIDRLW